MRKLGLWVWVAVLGTVGSMSVRSDPSKEIAIHETTAPTIVSLHFTPDRHIVLAGSLYAESSAWAESVDDQGHIQWRLTVPMQGASRAFSPVFNGAALLRNGNVALCGRIGTDRFSPIRGLVDFVDKDGRSLRKNHLLPTQNPAVRIAEVKSCVAWQSGVVALGKAVAPNPAKSSGVDEFYWITYWDASGRLLKEQMLPTGLKQLDKIGVPQTDPEGNALFCASGGRQSEVVAIDKDGAVSARATWPGEYLLVQSTLPTITHQIISADFDRPWEVLTLDARLKTVHRSLSLQPLNLILSAVVSVDNESLFAFGEQAEHGVPKGAAVAMASRDLKQVSLLDVPSLANSSNVSSVAYDQGAHRFLLAHTFTTNDGAATSLTYLAKKPS